MDSFHAWLKLHDVQLHSALEVKHANGKGLHVTATEDIVQVGSRIATIPKRVVLSRRTAPVVPRFVNEALKNATRSPHIELAICVLYQHLLGAQSPWKEYLDALPVKTVPVACLWAQDSSARAWVVGTELDKVLSETGALDKQHLCEFFDRNLVPLSSHFPRHPTQDDFLRAFSLVSSRAFHVDAWHGVALVPLADAFDHSDEHDVHFASDPWVCPECGSFDQCEHDELSATGKPAGQGQCDSPSPPKEDGDEDSCELVSVRTIRAGQEVMNTYGGRELSNARLLAYYGFALPGNKHDRVSFSLDEVVPQTSTARNHHQQEWSRLLKEWQSEQSGRLSQPGTGRTANHEDAVDSDDDDDEDEIANGDKDTLLSDPLSADLFCDADARLSHALWLRLAFHHLRLPALRVEWLLDLHQFQNERHTGEVSAFPLESPRHSELSAALDMMASAVSELVSRRLEKQCEQHKTSADLFELAEACQDVEERMAIEFLASERVLLSTLKQTWDELRAGAEEDGLN